MFVSEFSIWLNAAHERYLAAKKLIENSKNDPPGDPYKSNYEAREILAPMLAELEKYWIGIGSLQTKLLSALLKYELGVISIATDETSAGCGILTSALNEIREIAEQPECCHLAINTLNQLGLLWSKRGSEEKSLKYLLEAKTIYENYKANNSVRPLDFEEIFTMENASSQNWNSFEKTFTHTLFYMAQVYEHLKDGAKTAEYCKETLRRQLEFKDYDRIEWTANCTTLSLYFVQEKLFPEARHLLCCSQYLLSDCRPEPTMDRRIADQQRDQIRNSKAFVATCWAKYCNAVLAEPQNPEKDCKNIPQIDRFINVWPLVIQESEIPCQIKNYDEARAVFLWGIKCIDAAKSYFRLNEYATNYSQLVEEHSKLFKNLAAHDPDLNRQCKMHKRRMDQLTALVRSLNPQFYMSLCRQLQFELGEICHEMIHLKTRIANETIEGISISKAAKISSLATQGISHFENFINTFKDKEGKLPDTFSEDNVRPILIAHFYIGRYCSKLLETDPNNKEHNLSKLKEYFTFVVKYVEANPDHASTIENELPLAKEMLEYMTERANQVVMSATS